MSDNPELDDEVMSLDEVFRPEDEALHLRVTSEERGILKLVIDAGGEASLQDLIDKSGYSSKHAGRIVDGLVEKGILGRGATPGEELEGESASKDSKQYLEKLQSLNFYQVLGVSLEAGSSQIKHAYFKLMHDHHPDRFLQERDEETREDLKEIFRILTKAYETLTDPKARQEYDLTIPGFTGALDREEDRAIEALLEGKPEGAIPEASINPSLAKSFFDSALDDYQSEDYRSAELNFKLAAALNPQVKEYREGLDKARRINNRKRAREAAVKALFFEESQKYRSAVRWMMWAAELDPENVEYQYDAARLMVALGEDLQAARTHIVLALDSHPGKVDYLLLFARIQERLGEKTDARRTCRKILSLAPKNPEAKNIMQRLEQG